MFFNIYKKVFGSCNRFFNKKTYVWIYFLSAMNNSAFKYIYPLKIRR